MTAPPILTLTRARRTVPIAQRGTPTRNLDPLWAGQSAQSADFSFELPAEAGTLVLWAELSGGDVVQAGDVAVQVDADANALVLSAAFAAQRFAARTFTGEQKLAFTWNEDGDVALYLDGAEHYSGRAAQLTSSADARVRVSNRAFALWACDRVLTADEIEYLHSLERPPALGELGPDATAEQRTWRWLAAMNAVQQGDVLSLNGPEISTRALRGAGVPDVNLVTSVSPFRDGVTSPSAANVTERLLTADVEITPRGEESTFARANELRRILIEFISPKAGPVLVTWIPDENAFVAEAWYSGGFAFDEFGEGNTQTALLELTCPDPAWREASPRYAQSFRQAGEAGLDVAVNVPIDVVGADAIILAQGGTLAVRPLFVLHGPVNEPTIVLPRTGEEFSIDVEIPDGQVVEVDFDALTVQQRSEHHDAGSVSILAERSPTSVFFEINPSDAVQFRAASNMPWLVEVYWAQRYLGV